MLITPLIKQATSINLSPFNIQLLENGLYGVRDFDPSMFTDASMRPDPANVPTPRVIQNKLARRILNTVFFNASDDFKLKFNTPR
jgi:hypothetical protein